jgi:hypothetical protein
MDPLTPIFRVIYSVIPVPNLRLRTPTILEKGLPRMLIFSFMIVSYFFVLSGIIYDMIMEPPSIGSTRDEKGRVKPVVILEYRMNGQYMIEGFSAGLLFVMGGMGFIISNWAAAAKLSKEQYRYILFVVGALMVVLSFHMTVVFLRYKVPGYSYF